MCWTMTTSCSGLRCARSLPSSNIWAAAASTTSWSTNTRTPIACKNRFCWLKPDGRGLTVVGDDAQSIYSFRAAEVRNILDFPTRFPEPARVVTLERNYRSTDAILNAANAVIAEAAERFTKNLRTERRSAEKPLLVTVRDEAEQACYVAEQVLEAREKGIALKQQAVSRLAPLRAAEGGAYAPQHPLRQVRRLEIPGFRPCEGRPCSPAFCREPSAAASAMEGMERALDPVLGLQLF